MLFTVTYFTHYYIILVCAILLTITNMTISTMYLNVSCSNLSFVFELFWDTWDTWLF